MYLLGAGNKETRMKKKKKGEITGRSAARIPLMHFPLLIFSPVPAESAFSFCQPVNKKIKRLVTLAEQVHSTPLEVLDQGENLCPSQGTKPSQPSWSAQLSVRGFPSMQS